MGRERIAEGGVMVGEGTGERMRLGEWVKMVIVS